MATATINGVELYYEEHGSGPPILFHHGFTGSHDGFVPIAERLRDRFRCILMDCRGAGDSERPAGGYTIEQYAKDVVGMLDHLGLDQVAYVGHSMGGGIGFQLGLEHADRFTHIMLVTPISADGYSPDPLVSARGRQLRMDGERETLIRERKTGIAREELIDEDEVAAAVDRSLSVSDGHYDDGMVAMATLNVGDRLGEMTTPTLMITAGADALLPANLADFLRLPNASLHVFNRVAHGVQGEVPDEFAELVGDFVTHGVVNPQTLADRLAAVQAEAAAV